MMPKHKANAHLAAAAQRRKRGGVRHLRAEVSVTCGFLRWSLHATHHNAAYDSGATNAKNTSAQTPFPQGPHDRCDRHHTKHIFLRGAAVGTNCGSVDGEAGDKKDDLQHGT